MEEISPALRRLIRQRQRRHRLIHIALFLLGLCAFWPLQHWQQPLWREASQQRWQWQQQQAEQRIIRRQLEPWLP